MITKGPILVDDIFNYHGVYGKYSTKFDDKQEELTPEEHAFLMTVYSMSILYRSELEKMKNKSEEKAMEIKSYVQGRIDALTCTLDMYVRKNCIDNNKTANFDGSHFLECFKDYKGEDIKQIVSQMPCYIVNYLAKNGNKIDTDYSELIAANKISISYHFTGSKLTNGMMRKLIDMRIEAKENLTKKSHSKK